MWLYIAYIAHSDKILYIVAICYIYISDKMPPKYSVPQLGAMTYSQKMLNAAYHYNALHSLPKILYTICPDKMWKIVICSNELHNVPWHHITHRQMTMC